MIFDTYGIMENTSSQDTSIETIIQEIYFGKDAKLQAIENQLDKFRSKYMENYSFSMRCNSDPDLIKFNRMIEDYFGFGCFCLMVMNQAEVNACTAAIDMKLDILNTSKNLIVDEKRFKFNKKASYSCLVLIYSGILFNPSFSTEECMGIILHEIGHNFFTAIQRRYTIFSSAYTIVCIYNDILYTLSTGKINAVASDIVFATNIGQKLLLKINETIRDNSKILSFCLDGAFGIFNLLGTVRTGVLGLANILSMGLLSVFQASMGTYFTVINPLNWVFLPYSYNNEKSADNFATIYGYGPALSSALSKLTSTKSTPSKILKAFYKIPLLSNLYCFNMNVAYIISGAIDEHPQEVLRIQDQIEMLEDELSKTALDPKMRKVINADLKACKVQFEESSRLLDTGDLDFMKNAWNNSIANTKFNLKDALFNDRDRFRTADTAYNSKK